MAGGGRAQFLQAAAGVEPAASDDNNRERFVDLQRARLVAAMVDVAAEKGLSAATVARVVARSGVSRRTFYESFEDRDQCFVAAFEDSIARLAAAVVPAYNAGGAWPVRLRAALAALLEALTYEPAAARVAVVEVLGAG
ncbi:MAG: TetR/AcrR family transcriptional regulator, partial [Solirubrobacteraceae bacterium]